MKFGEKRQTQLHHSLNQMAHSSQNRLILPTTSKIRDDMPAKNTDTTHPSISGKNMKDQNVNFEFRSECGRGEKMICCLSTMTSHRDLTTWMENDRIIEDNIYSKNMQRN
jgi:hypothetical protein